jgi:site-specific recombinase XerD
VGANPKVVRFMKGVYELRTPKPKYTEVWDVNILLNLLRQKKDNADLGLKELTQKLCALFMIATAQRVQTLWFVNISCIQFSKEGCVVVISGKLKHSRLNFNQEPFNLKFYPEEKLCVVRCLQEYINRTSSIRENYDQLLLCYQKPHKPASKDTIARWLGDVLNDAGIKGFSPHSFRGAASSAMLREGCTLEHIMKSAGWSNAKTFQKFYNKPVMSAEKPKNIITDYFRKK